MLQERLGLSQRRACQIVGQHRSTQRHAPAEPDPDRDLRERMVQTRPPMAEHLTTPIARPAKSAVRGNVWSGPRPPTELS
jgi:hypothetical protein